jgi:hypothetical protein
MDATELIDRYCEVWNLPNSEQRAEALAAVWAVDATYTDPSVHAKNGDELLAHIAMVRARRPGAKVVRVSRLDSHHGFVRFAWRVELADGTLMPEGLDIAFFTADGARIARILGFFGPLAV